MEIRLQEEQQVINHVHDVCDRMIGRIYHHEERIVKVLGVHTDAHTVTITTDIGDIGGLSAADIREEVKEFIPENTQYITTTYECDRSCGRLVERLDEAHEMLINGDSRITAFFVDAQNKYARSIIEANKVRKMNAAGFISSGRRDKL